MTLNTTEDLAAALIAAHDGGPLIDSVPAHLRPVDMPAVVALQDMIVDRIGAVGGWKVMAGGTGEPLCAPIPTNRYFADGETIDAARHRLVLVELEIGVKLGQDLAADADLAAVEAAIASIHPTLELIGSPFVDRDAVDFNTKLADLQSNGCVVVGQAMEGLAKNAFSTLMAELTFDGTVATTAGGGASWQAILEALRWLASHSASRGLQLRQGQVIITGSRVIAPIGQARLIQGQLGLEGTVAARIQS
ncbi:MAG: hypothetical protein P0Y65_07150 [Candidatus Devosia phytovorans]|uniref:2-keto-4-pentenoate hydratase n=1 Tax=Candidatus Devosia phytovorans TaxID=3121372 RepID=A0AAJ6B250_9HYPH|nr:hypothetical protein [Devosia sp.]WEK06024.1 MAG: hypothetical protein P0Y65_07150 [Devosia sp.]